MELGKETEIENKAIDLIVDRIIDRFKPILRQYVEQFVRKPNVYLAQPFTEMVFPKETKDETG
jgi:flagellar motor switch protein FliM